MAGQALLEVEDLRTAFMVGDRVAKAVDGVSFRAESGRTLAIVGESGCGKSVTALSILGLVPSPPGRIVGGSIRFEGRELRDLPPRDWQDLRGNAISMIFQEPATSLNPVFRTGRQVAAVLRKHRGLDAAAAKQETIALFARAGIPDPERRFENYPHQMSGGMLQRVMIAMALACKPKLLIADEPTTALDVTVQAQILELLRTLQAETGVGLILITHDLGVVAELADEVAVMYAGKIVEQAPVGALFENPQHPYTQGLFASRPSGHQTGDRLQAIAGTVPAATNFPAGCRFAPRCRHAFEACSGEPPLRERGPEHQAACWWGTEHASDG